MLASWERFCMDSRCAIEEVAASQCGDALVGQLARLWERSVRATHLFLSEDDIVAMRPEVREGLRAVLQLAVAFDDGAPLGFAGVADGKLEMLFVDDAARGRGIGSALLKHAVDRWGVHRLDVNEQTPPPPASTSTRASAWRRARNSTRREGRSPSYIWNAARGSACGAGLKACERASRQPDRLVGVRSGLWLCVPSLRACVSGLRACGARSE